MVELGDKARNEDHPTESMGKVNLEIKSITKAKMGSSFVIEVGLKDGKGSKVALKWMRVGASYTAH